MDKMCNVNCLYFEYFDFGCEMTVELAEYETGPYTKVINKKYFARTIHRKVKLGTLPCRYIKITVHKGCLINPKSVYAFGFSSEDAPELFGSDVFPLIVAGPQRLMFS
mmetsp:Transcript_3767/g.3208  ORF Transcript_3767/g.3208 Transcript_3767/m.3208 type:complete len:108 (+) Transcript_3767:195-518(+)